MHMTCLLPLGWGAALCMLRHVTVRVGWPVKPCCAPPCMICLLTNTCLGFVLPTGQPGKCKVLLSLVPPLPSLQRVRLVFVHACIVTGCRVHGVCVRRAQQGIHKFS